MKYGGMRFNIGLGKSIHILILYTSCGNILKACATFSTSSGGVSNVRGGKKFGFVLHIVENSILVNGLNLTNY